MDFKLALLWVFWLLVVVRLAMLMVGQWLDSAPTLSESSGVVNAPTLDALLLAAQFDTDSNNVTSTDQARVAVVSLYLGSAGELRTLTWHNKQKYAARHGYKFIDLAVDNQTLLAEVNNIVSSASAPVNLLKIYVLLHLLPHWDWVLWSDADALFLNHGRSLLQAGVLDTDFDLVLSTGHPMDWQWGKVLNSGHFAVRNSAWSRQFLRDLWRDSVPRAGAQCPDRPFHDVNNWLSLCTGADEQLSFWLGDQGALQARLRSSKYPTDFVCHVKWLNMRDMNSEWPWWDSGDLVVHMPGKSITQRREVINHLLTHTDWETGRVNFSVDVELEEWSAHGVEDWRVQPRLFDDYRGAGWNIACRELFTHS